MLGSVLLASVSLAALLAACGSGGDSPPPATGTAEPTAQGLESLDGYHYVASLTVREMAPEQEPAELLIVTEGDFRRPDRHAFTYTVEIGGLVVSRSAVIIGEEAWLLGDDGEWRPVAFDGPELTELVAIAFSPAQPDFLGGEAYLRLLDSIRQLASTEGTVNDVPSLRYVVHAEGRSFFQSFLAEDEESQTPSETRWELWLAKDGSWPVRLSATTTVESETAPLVGGLVLEPPTSWELRIDISRANDPALTIEPPDGS